MSPGSSDRSRAALLALGAICLWSFLAFLGSRLAGLPPLLMTGVALSIGGTAGLIKVREWKVPLARGGHGPDHCRGRGGLYPAVAANVKYVYNR